MGYGGVRKETNENVDRRIGGVADVVVGGLKMEYGWIVRMEEGAIRRIRNQN